MHFLGRKLLSFEGSCIRPKALGGAEKISACQLALHGSRELVDLVYFCRRLAYVSRRVKFFSRWRLRALSKAAMLKFCTLAQCEPLRIHSLSCLVQQTDQSRLDRVPAVCVRAVLGMSGACSVWHWLQAASHRIAFLGQPPWHVYRQNVTSLEQHAMAYGLLSLSTRLLSLSCKA